MRHEKCHLMPSGDDATDPVSQPHPVSSHIQLSSITSSVLPTPSHTDEHPNSDPSFTFTTSQATSSFPLNELQRQAGGHELGYGLSHHQIEVDEFHLVPGPFEECLPKHLMERNQSIRSLWNDGALQLNKSLGDSPAVLKKKMNIVERRLYIPTASPTSSPCSNPAASSSLQQLNIAPSPSHGLAIASSPDTGFAIAASQSSHPGHTPLQSSDPASETGQLCSKFWCGICMKGFGDNAHLRRHKRNKHEPRY